jgi:hypothetical protein
MSNDQEQFSAQDEDPAGPSQQQQQPQSGSSEKHGGQGSESAMKQMRVWEQRRASNSGGTRRSGPR